jgi:hypothetical protein
MHLHIEAEENHEDVRIVGVVVDILSRTNKSASLPPGDYSRHIVLSTAVRRSPCLDYRASFAGRLIHDEWGKFVRNRLRRKGGTILVSVSRY